MSGSPFRVPDDDLRRLRAWIDVVDGRAALRMRAEILVLLHEGVGPTAVARKLGCSVQTVTSWRDRFRADGIDGLSDAPRSGRPVEVDGAAVVRATLEPRADGGGRWSSRSLGAQLGVSNATVASVWRSWGVRPGRASPVALQLDPVLDVPLVDIVGLYVDRDVQIAVVRADDAPRAQPTAWRGGIGDDLSGLGAARIELEPAVAALERAGFLRALGPSGHPSSGTVHVLVAGRGAPERCALVEQPGVGVHRVAPPLRWDRVVRVACALVAQAGQDGRAAVAELRSAIGDDAGRGPFSWTRRPEA